MNRIQYGGVESPVVAMTKQEFFALTEDRIRDNAGSGFAEWGKNSTTFGNVNQGISCTAIDTNMFFLGRATTSTEGISRASTPIVYVNGTKHIVNDTAYFTPSWANVLKLPPAPDGTKTYDSATGAVVTHTSAAEAFEGFVTNSDLSGWTASGDSTAVVGNEIKVASSVSLAASIVANYSFISGKEYTVSWTARTSGVTPRCLLPDGTSVTGVGYFSKTFTANGSNSLVFNYLGGNIVGEVFFAGIEVRLSTDSVITSRQDFTFLESFHEKISDKDVVYPLGNVQNGVSSWEGITLSNTLVAQGYSAFGEWDTITKGYGVVWSTLSDANKTKFIQDSENNIYNDDGELIQVRYRIRVIEGLADAWDNVTNFQVGLTLDANKAVKPRGSLVTVEDLNIYNQGDTGFYNDQLFWGADVLQNGAWLAVNQSFVIDTAIAHNGLCFAVPIALVQRKNTGAYDPTLNPEGTGRWNSTGTTSTGTTWYSGRNQPISKYEAFKIIPDASADTTTAGVVAVTGYIGTISGRPDNKFYDATYASDVQDLRMSSKLLPHKEIREKYKRMAIAGEVRGFEGVPFTTVTPVSVTNGTYNGRLYFNQSEGLRNLEVLSNLPPTADSVTRAYIVSRTSGYIFPVSARNWSDNDYFVSPDTFDGTPPSTENWDIVTWVNQTHKQANPTWTDIIGNPANIAATFPEGVEGQWIPVIPSGGSINVHVPLNRKSLVSINSREWTMNDGVSWNSKTTNTINTTLNTSVYGDELTIVLLEHYATQAHFTEDSNNSKVLDLGGVFAVSDSNVVRGNTLIPSLIGKIGVNGGGTSRWVDTNISSFSLLESRLLLGGVGWNPTNDTLTLGGTSTTVKTLDYLSQSNNVAKLCYAYKEIMYDSTNSNGNTFINVTGGTAVTTTNGQYYHVTSGRHTGYWFISGNGWSGISFDDVRWSEVDDTLKYENGSTYATRWDGNGWGDNNEFEVTDNQGVQTDDNGNIVVYGTASFNTQYFTVEE